MLLEENAEIPAWLVELVPAIRKILEEYNIERAWIFGSSLQTEHYNDIDILIDPPERFTLFDLVGLEQEISSRTGKKIDVVVRRSVDERIAKYIRGVRIL